MKLYKYFYFILFFLNSFLVHSTNYEAFENEKNTLIEKLESTHGYERVKIYQKLAMYYALKLDDKNKFFYINEAINYSIKTKDDYSLSLALRLDIDFNLSNLDLQINSCIDGVRLSRKTNNREALCLTLLKISYFYFNLNSDSQANNFLNLAEKIANDYNVSKIEIYNLKMYISRQKNYDKLKSKLLIEEYLEYFNINKNKLSEIEKCRFYVHMAYRLHELKLNQTNTANLNYLPDLKINDFNLSILLKLMIDIKSIEPNNTIKKNNTFNFINKITLNYYRNVYYKDQVKYNFLLKEDKITEVFYDLESKIYLNDGFFIQYSKAYLTNYKIFESYNANNSKKINIIKLKYFILENYKIKLNDLSKIKFFDIYNEEILVQKNYNYYLYILIIILTIVLILLSFKFYKTSKNKLGNNSNNLELLSNFEIKWNSFIENNDIYLKYDNLNDAANYLDINSKFLRNYIKSNYNKSFPQFINELKINYLIKFLMENKDKTSQDDLKAMLGYKSINSLKANFYNVKNLKLSEFINKLKYK
jgi:hypothetical protein